MPRIHFEKSEEERNFWKYKINKFTKEERCSYYNVCGYVLLEEKEEKKARDIYRQYFEYAKSIDDASHIHKAYHQLAMVERMCGNYKEAVKFIESERELIDLYFAEDALCRAVNIYEYAYLMFLLQNINLAEKEMNTALKYAEESDDLIAKACCYRGLGEILDAKSLLAYEKSIELFQEAGDFIGAEEVEALKSKRDSHA